MNGCCPHCGADPEVTKLARNVLEAVMDEGSAPEVHRRIVARHRREWPTLWRRLDALMMRVLAERRSAAWSEMWPGPRTRHVEDERKPTPPSERFGVAFLGALTPIAIAVAAGAAFVAIEWLRLQ